jgi:hypothetical protein
VETSEVLKFIWGRINNPHSMCPDVEIGYVRRVLGEAMALELVEIIAGEVDQFVLGQILVSPMSFSSLWDDWYESKHIYVQRPEPPDDNYEDEIYQKAIENLFAAEDKEREQRSQEVKDALERLAGRQLVVEANSRYNVNSTNLKLLVEMGNIP